MEVKCSECGAAVERDQIDLTRRHATCRYCGTTTRLSKRSTARPTPQERETDGELVPLPERFRIDESEGGLTIVRPWFSPVAFILAPFAIAWDSFLIFWYSKALEGDAPWIMFVFPIAHLAIGFGLTYFTLGIFMNRTEVKVNNGRLSVWNGPLPWIGNVSVDTADITQIYGQEKVTRTENSTRTDYQVYALTTSGRRIQLLVGLNEAAQAIYIERRLEHQLDIRDEPVAGELPR